MTKDMGLLLERLRGAKGPDRWLSRDIWQALNTPEWRSAYLRAQEPCGCPHDQAVEYAERYLPDITDSIDASLALVERCGFPLGLGKWNYTMAAAYGSFSIIPNDPHSTGIHDKRCGHAHGAPTIPLAILAALLSALEEVR